MEPNRGRVLIEGARDTSVIKAGVTNASYTLVSDRPTRRFLSIKNEGATTIWLGLSTNLSAGVTGINIESLANGSQRIIEQYTGPVYAVAGGASIAPAWINAWEAY